MFNLNYFIFISRWAGFILLSLSAAIASAKTTNDTVVVAEAVISNDTMLVMTGSTALPKNVVRSLSSKDKIIYFYSSLLVLNPTKDVYEGRIECVDKMGKTIIGADIQRKIYGKNAIGEDAIGKLEITLGLDPKPGSIIKGQTEPLKDGEEYYIRTYISGALVGISGFSYSVRK